MGSLFLSLCSDDISRRQTLNSGSWFALSSLRHESYRKEQSDLKRSLMGKLLPTLFFLFLVVGAYL